MSLGTKHSLFWFFFVSLSIAVSSLLVKAQAPVPSPVGENREPHLRNLKQLTFGGQNAEAYFSYDGAKIIFQSTRPPYQCDQIFSMKVDGSDVKLLNSGNGRTTCGFFFPRPPTPNAPVGSQTSNDVRGSPAVNQLDS